MTKEEIFTLLKVRTVEDGKFLMPLGEKKTLVQISKLLTDNMLLGIAVAEKIDNIETVRSEIYTILENAVQDSYAPEEEKEVFTSEDCDLEYSENFQINDLKLYTNVKDSNHVVVYNCKADWGLSEIDPKSVLKKLMAYKDAGMIPKTTLVMTHPAIIKFDPLNFKGLIGEEMFEGQMLPVLNEYRPPAWIFTRKEMLQSNTPIPPGRARKVFLDFVEVLFPDPTHRDYVLFFLQQSLLTIHSCMLVVVGGRGAGKTLLFDVVGELQGIKYYIKLRGKDLDNKFNAQLERKRLVFFDDVYLTTEEQVITMKQTLNKTIAIEGKGKEQKMIWNTASYAMAANSPECIAIHPSERKFSPVRSAEIKLDVVWSDRESDIDLLHTITGFDIKMTQEEKEAHLLDIGDFLLSYQPKNDWKIHQPYKSDVFYEMCVMAMVAWQTEMIKYILDNEYKSRAEDKRESMVGFTFPLYSLPTFSSLRPKSGSSSSLRQTKSRVPSIKTLKRFLSELVHDGKPYLELVLAPDKKYQIVVLQEIPKNLSLDNFLRMTEEELQESVNELQKEIVGESPVVFQRAMSVAQKAVLKQKEINKSIIESLEEEIYVDL